MTVNANHMSREADVPGRDVGSFEARERESTVADLHLSSNAQGERLFGSRQEVTCTDSNGMDVRS